MGRIVQGRFDKNDYITENLNSKIKPVRATPRNPFEEDGSGSGSGSGEGSGEEELDEPDVALVIALTIVALIILIGIPIYIIARGKVCLVGQCCSKS